MKCSICKDKIKPDLNGWGGGHNADPINDGRCCGVCNDTIVTPTRFNLYLKRENKWNKTIPIYIMKQ